MKALLTILAVVLLAVPYAWGDGNNGQTNLPIRLYPLSPRPKDTSHAEDNVTCHYKDGVLTFEFAEPEGKALLTVTRLEDGDSATASFMTYSTYSFTVGTAPGTYRLDLITSRDQYQGWLTIE